MAQAKNPKNMLLPTFGYATPQSGAFAHLPECGVYRYVRLSIIARFVAETPHGRAGKDLV